MLIPKRISQPKLTKNNQQQKEIQILEKKLNSVKGKKFRRMEDKILITCVLRYVLFIYFVFLTDQNMHSIKWDTNIGLMILILN